MSAVEIRDGFAQVGAGSWLVSRGQPAVFAGALRRLRRKGWMVRDRSILDHVELSGEWAKCADASRPFLTHIPCAAEVSAVSRKVLVAPAGARKDAKTLRSVPLSTRFSFPVTVFDLPGEEESAGTENSWVVMATESRTTRITLEDEQTASVRPEAAVAWTTKMPTGFCPRLSIWNILLPRGPRDMLLTFYGPGVVWVEGSSSLPAFAQAPMYPGCRRRAYGV